MCPSGRIPPRANTIGVSDFRQAFDVLDTDHDGKISLNDLRTFYSSFSGVAPKASDDDIDSMISVADSNKNGFVEFDEFESVVLDSWKGDFSPVNGMMKDVFRVLDKDGDGKVGFEDLKSYMNWAGFSASDEDIRGMIRLGGGDEKAGVCYEDLSKILALDFAGVE